MKNTVKMNNEPNDKVANYETGELTTNKTEYSETNNKMNDI